MLRVRFVVERNRAKNIVQIKIVLHLLEGLFRVALNRSAGSLTVTCLYNNGFPIDHHLAAFMVPIKRRSSVVV